MPTPAYVIAKGIREPGWFVGSKTLDPDVQAFELSATNGDAGNRVQAVLWVIRHILSFDLRGASRAFPDCRSLWRARTDDQARLGASKDGGTRV